MSPRKSANLPLKARIKSTLNLRPSTRGFTVAANQTARRVVEYLHRRILENPDRYQRYSHEEVGAALGIDPKRVALSLAHGGLASTTVEVTPESRAAIAKSMRDQEASRSIPVDRLNSQNEG
jgi:hypothetical protein